jgi:hypothetical protein
MSTSNSSVKWGPNGAVMNRVSRFGTSFRECWRKMTLMNTAFEHSESGDGAASRERSEERLRDEEAWSRMDNEGCPNGGYASNIGQVTWGLTAA